MDTLAKIGCVAVFVVVGFVGWGFFALSAALPLREAHSPETRAWFKEVKELRESYWSRGPDARAFMLQLYRAECDKVRNDKVRNELCENAVFFITDPDARNAQP
jgi:hypothetical protein